MKLQKQIKDLEKSINNYVEILREKENAINEYKNKYLKIKEKIKNKKKR